MQKKLKNMLAALLLAGTVCLTASRPAAAQSKPSEAGPSIPRVGGMAPDFTLKYFDGNDLKEISLSQYRGKKNVVLAFFIFAFTGG